MSFPQVRPALALIAARARRLRAGARGDARSRPPRRRASSDSSSAATPPPSTDRATPSPAGSSSPAVASAAPPSEPAPTAARSSSPSATAFPNGEGGICAPLDGRIVLGAGSADRLVLAVSGDSCQDGAGPLTAASFTGLARFTVKRGSGSYAGATGDGLASFSEDAANHHRMTLIGRVAADGAPHDSHPALDARRGLRGDGHAHARHRGGQHRAVGHRRRPRHRPLGPAVGRRRLHASARGDGHHRRLARRPLRPPPAVHASASASSPPPRCCARRRSRSRCSTSRARRRASARRSCSRSRWPCSPTRSRAWSSA